MEDSGLNSSILSPFCDALPEFDCQGPEFPPAEELTCDPYSTAYTDALFHALDLDSLEYSTVDVDIMKRFKELICQYPTVFLLPGSPLGAVKGFEHRIEHIVTTSYHPRLNGSTERVHRWLNAVIGIYYEKYQERWEEFLQPAVYADNVSPIPGTGQISPFFLVFGHNAPSPEAITLDLPVESLSRSTYAEQLVFRMREAQKQFNSIKADMKNSERIL